MSWVLTCDNPACAAEISAGEGQPALHQRPKIYCEACAVYVAQVEAQLRTEAAEFASQGVSRLSTRRAELMAKMLPTTRGGTGEGHSQWPQVAN